MEDTIVSFEVAKLLKDREFNENCSYYYIHELGNSGYFKKLHGSLSMFKVQDDSGDTIGYSKRKNSPGQPHIIIAPTLSLAQKWLREVHDIIVFIEPKSSGSNVCKFLYNIATLNNIWILKNFQ